MGSSTLHSAARADEVAALKPDLSRLTDLPPRLGVNTIAGEGSRWKTRMFAPGGGVAEDPATGSATANFGGWLLATGHALPVEIEISQGEAIRRPSTLYLRVDDAKRIFVSGEVVDLGTGLLRL